MQVRKENMGLFRIQNKETPPTYYTVLQWFTLIVTY